MALTHLFSLPHLCFLTQNLPKQYPIKTPLLGNQKFRNFQCLATNTHISHPEVKRQSANYQPSIWSYDFVQSLKNDYVDKLYEDRVKKLEEDARSMINYENTELLATLELIDDIQRLGLGYRFEKDIKRALDRFASAGGCNDRIIEKSLHATALSFRLLRQHGYEVSQDVFNSFKDHNGNFKACLSKDVKGMLSLYEASYLAFEGENLLDKAVAFTGTHLKDLKRDVISKSLEEQISHALELPLHHRMQRLEARWYIEAYNKREDANLVLLELAKLDFNIVQSVHQRDLQDMSRWWKYMGLANKLSFSRDRLMESFFWTVGMVFEPQFSNPRKGLTKVVSFITTIDDIYDVYGTLDELELFTDSVERWDVNAVKVLPEYMQLCFLALYNTVNEMAYDTLKDKGVNSLPYLTKAWADMCKAFLQEAKWSYNKDTPTFKEYIDNGWQSVSGVVLLVHAYFLLNQNITKQALEGLECYHDLLRWPSVIFRLSNDLSTSAAESERGETAKSILCYMRDTGLSEEIAYKHISSMIDKTWEKMNEERVVDSPFAQPFVETAINLARIAQCTYQYGDGHGAPDSRSKNRILSLIIEPISDNMKSSSQKKD